MAMATLQQHTTAATMDMSWMVYTLGDASMMVHGLERLQNAVREIEVSFIATD